jgi:dTMP kinase
LKSLFITFEGIDGSGKSTQAKLLHDYYKSKTIPVILTREPGGTVISEKIRELILNPEHLEMTPITELLLYLAARNQHTNDVIIPSLKEKINVICDRYTDSTLAYQSISRNLDYETVVKINSFATQETTPDLTFLIDIPVELIAQRLANKKVDRMELETLKFHDSVRKAYLKLANDSKRIIVIDGTNEINLIHNDIIDKINTYIQEK